MKNAPFLLSTLLALAAVILSVVSFGAAQTNNSLQAELLKKQSEIQDLTQVVTLQNQEYQRQAEIIQTGGQVAQKLGPQILRDMGYFVAKNKNEGLKKAMTKQKLEGFIPNPEQLKEMDRQLDELRAKQGTTSPAPAPKPAPATPPATPPAPSGTPALRP
jgi:hypothetical protein